MGQRGLSHCIPGPEQLSCGNGTVNASLQSGQTKPAFCVGAWLTEHPKSITGPFQYSPVKAESARHT